MCRKPDSLVSFYLIYFYIYRVLFTYFYLFIDLLFSKMRQHLRCNLLFCLIGHFGLLKDVNISFFLSFFLYCNPKGILVFQTFSIARTEISDVDKLVKIYMVGSSTTCITAFREKSLFE